jgi:hypothetical protein
MRKAAKHVKALRSDQRSTLALAIESCETRAQLHAMCMVLAECRDVLQHPAYGPIGQINDRQARTLIDSIGERSE